jgi:hypothetical protein
MIYFAFKIKQKKSLLRDFLYYFNGVNIHPHSKDNLRQSGSPARFLQ